MDREFVFLRRKIRGHGGHGTVFSVQEGQDYGILLQPLVVQAEIGVVRGLIGLVAEADLVP